MINEINIIEHLQRMNLTTLMRIISTPFDLVVLTIMILVLYIYKILNLTDILFIIIGLILCILLKLLFRRPRPFVASNRVINYSNETVDVYSFPSGHTLMATIFFLILLNKYPKQKIFYVFILLVGISRIFLGAHYPTDVVAGIIFGVLYYNIIKNKL